MSAPSLTILLFVALVGIVVLLAAVIIGVLIATRRKTAPTAPESTEAQPASAAPEDRFAPIGSLHRDRQTGELVIERQGRLLRSADELTGESRKEIEKAAGELQAWLKPTAAQAPIEPAPAAAARPARSMVDLVAPRRPAAPGSMVEQIDEILQEMLAASGHADRAIHLSERPECGVLVWIGAQRFEGIDSVPDEEVKALLRAAVQEWERRQTV